MTPEIEAMVGRHNRHYPGEHTNLEVVSCACSTRKLPGMDGPACPYCGGMTQRTGTCATCTSCGNTTGCG